MKTHKTIVPCNAVFTDGLSALAWRVREHRASWSILFDFWKPCYWCR